MLRCTWLAAFVVLFACLSGCASLGAGRAIETARFEECHALDDSFLAWKAVGYAGSGIAAAGGAGGALVEGVADADEGWTIGLSVAGAVGAIMAGLGTFMSSEYAERWSETCGEPIAP